MRGSGGEGCWVKRGARAWEGRGVGSVAMRSGSGLCIMHRCAGGVHASRALRVCVGNRVAANAGDGRLTREEHVAGQSPGPSPPKPPSQHHTQIYSRNSEDNTGKYPDIAALLPRMIKPGVKSAVLDAEAVAYDRVEKRVLPFQVGWGCGFMDNGGF